ncbi:MAG: hypothetical protein J0L75_11980 [Spirochaetes bacterium]|nr:hypothetical protein [Spirochaetota bacterium]
MVYLSNAAGMVGTNLAAAYGAGLWSNAWNVAALPDGAYWAWIGTTNGAGLATNTLPVSVWLNENAPVVAETNTAAFAWISGTWSFRGLATNGAKIFDPPFVHLATNGGNVVTGATNTNWVLPYDTTLLPDGTNVFTFRAISSNFRTNTYAATNLIDNTAALTFLTNPTNSATVWGSAVFAGTNAENVSFLKGWKWSTNGGATWTTALSNTNSAWFLALDTTSHADGALTLEVRSTNATGLEGSASFTVYVTNNAPTATITAPTNFAWVTNGIESYTGGASSAPAPLTGVWFATNASGPWAAPAIAGVWSTNLNVSNLANTTNAFWILVSNAAGKGASNVVTNLIDLTPPALSFAAAYSNGVLNGLTNLAGTAGDPFAPVTLRRLAFETNGVEIASFDLTALSTNWATNIDTALLADGTYNLRLTATNAAGLGANLLQTNLFLSNAGVPVAAITNLTNLQWVTNANQYFAGWASNAGFQLSTVLFGSNLAALAPATGTTNWSTTLAMGPVDGLTNVFYVVASNAAGKTATNVLTNRIDLTPPGLSLAAAWNNATFTASTNLTGSVTEAAIDPITFLQVSVLTNGAVRSNYSLAAAAGAFATNFDTSVYPLGFYDLRFTVSNQAGWTNGLLATNILFNNFSGALAMLQPTNNAYVSGVTILTGFVTAPNSAFFMSNGATAGAWVPMTTSGTNGLSNFDTTALADGAQVFAFRATNGAGLPYGQTNISVVVDNSPAAVALTNPAAGAYLAVSGGKATFYGTNGDAHSGISQTVVYLSNAAGMVGTNLAAAYGAGLWSNAWNVAALPDGAYWAWIGTTNGAGLATNTLPVSVWLNENAPVVAETNTAAFAWISGTWSFRGLATNGAKIFDPPFVHLATNGGNVVTGATNTNWVLPYDTTLLPDGTNVFTFRAISSNFRTNTYAATNLIDNTAALTFLTNPTNSATVWGSAVFAGTNAENVSFLKGWKWSTNGGATWTTALSNTNSAWFLALDTTSHADGALTLEVRSTNATGLEGSASFTVYVTNNAPTATITAPTNFAWVTNGIESYTGGASSAPAPLTGVWFATNASGPWAAPAIAGVWSTNLNVSNLANTTNAFWILVSNAAGKGASNVVTNLIDLTPPALSFAAAYSNGVLNGLTNLAGTAGDPFAPVTFRRLGLVTNGIEVVGWDLSALASNWATNINTAGYADGMYDLRLTASNAAGLGAFLLHTNVFLSNAGAASVAITNATNLQWLTNASVVFSGWASNSGVALASVVFGTNNNAFAAVSGTTNWSTNVNLTGLADRTNVFWIIASNQSGGAATNWLTNRIDLTPPALAWNAVWDNASFTGTTNLGGVVTEIAMDPITFLQLSVLTNGAVRSNYQLPAQNGAWATNLDTTPYALGWYDLRLSVSNQAGWSNLIFATNLLFNNFTGALATLKPTNGQYVSGVTMLTGFVTAPNSAMFVSNAATAGGWAAMAMATSNGATNLDTTAFVDGAQVFAVRATNAAGFPYGLTNLSVVVDNSPAAVALTNLAMGQFLNSATGWHVLTGTNADPHSGILTTFVRLSNLSGAGSLAMVPVGGSGFSNGWNVSALPEGPYWLWTETTNGAGLMTNTATVKVWLNRLAPVLSVTNTAPFALLTGTYTFRGVATNAFAGYDNQRVEIWTNAAFAWSGLGTNWAIPIDTSLLPDGTNVFTFRAVSTNFVTNNLLFTNVIDNTGATAFVTNPGPAGTAWGNFVFQGTNREPESALLGWEWSTNGGATWTSAASNTNAAWILTLDTTLLPNGPMPFQMRLSNAAGLVQITTPTLYVSNSPATILFTAPAPMAWITNASEPVSGTATSAPAPLLSVLFATNAAGPWRPPLGTAAWSTNSGNWIGLNRTTNAFWILATNGTGGVSNSQTNLFELTRPPAGFAPSVPNSNVSNVAVIAGYADSFSPATQLVIEVLSLGTPVARASILGSLAGSNWTWPWDTTALTNGTYDLRLSLTNAAGWFSNVHATNLQVTNATSYHLQFAALEAPASNLVAGVAAPFHLTLFDQFTNRLMTNGAVPLVFAGLGLSPKGDLPAVGGAAQGAWASINFTAGIASNVMLTAVKSGTQVLTVASATNLTNLPLSVSGGVAVPDTSFFAVEPIGGTVATDLTNRLWANDAYSNAAGTLPTFVFLRYAHSNSNFQKDLTMDPAGSNEFRALYRAGSGMGRYVASAYLGGMNEGERAKRDVQAPSDGWISLDLYDVPASNIEALIDQFSGGPTLTQNPIRKGQDLDLYFRGQIGQTVSVLVHDLGGRILRRQVVVIRQEGLQSLHFQSRDAQGRELPAGLYFILLQSSEPHTEKYFKLVITR